MGINNFEEHVSGKILARGRDYYASGCVVDMERFGKNRFGAVVEGTEDYNVSVEIDRNLNVVRHQCDCPYDWGDICKHVVAVLFELRNNNAHFNMDTPGLASLLDGLEEGELRKFLLEMLGENGALRRAFKETFGQGR